tara:strand:- start:38 stop:769 length:732 start_codon:yes stop_codon:yes gene_type:complete
MPRPLIGITMSRRKSSSGERDLYGVLYPYVEAVCGQGGLPMLIPLGLQMDELRDLYDRADGLVLSGGGDIHPEQYGDTLTELCTRIDPERDELEFALVRWAAAEGKPILAICRGIQSMNVALGGTLWRDLATELPNAAKHDCYPNYPRDQRTHSLSVTPDSRLAQLLQVTSVEVNSLHHQACREVAPEMRQVAIAPDGIVEAAEIPNHPYAVGVQWHPEWIQDTRDQQGLFAGLVNACSNGHS